MKDVTETATARYQTVHVGVPETSPQESRRQGRNVLILVIVKPTSQQNYPNIYEIFSYIYLS